MAATRHRPAVSMFAEFAEAGGLMVYGPSLREAFRRCGGYVAKITRAAPSSPRRSPLRQTILRSGSCGLV